MKNRAFMALLLGAAGLWACGGGGSKVHLADAGADGGAGICNPVTNEGCGAGEKCADAFVGGGDAGPALHRTACVPDGSVAVGGACERMADDTGLSYDNCQAKSTCINGTCLTNCTSSPDSCGDAQACALYEHLFDDYTQEMLGVCVPTCDPVAQDCENADDACYLQVSTGDGTCASAPDDTHQQGDDCIGPDAMNCYLNGCSRGYGSPLFTSQGQACMAYCTPVDTYLIDPNGTGGDGTLNDGASAVGMGEMTDCRPARVGAGNQCRFYQSVVGQNGYLDYIPGAYGFCILAGADYGDCTMFSEERLLVVYDNAEQTEAGSGSAKLGEYCDANPSQCAVACASVETLNGLDDAYCMGPGMGGAACGTPAQKALQRPGRAALHRVMVKRAAKLGIPAEMVTP